MATDPVCLAIVDEEDGKFMSVYKDRKYYFCCDYCRKQFEENPQRYTRLAADSRIDLSGFT